MRHLKDKLAEFFYNELLPSEMADAKRHIEECAACRIEVEQFQIIHLTLRSAPDWDPPRSIIFSPPEQKTWLSWLDWRPLAASMATAALVAGIMIRLSPAVPPTPAAIPVTPPATVQAEKIDYTRIVTEVRESDREWMKSELQSRDREIQHLRAELAYYDTFQRAVMKETFENGSAIQLLAQRTEQR